MPEINLGRVVGTNGTNGRDGVNGTNGTDGVSPTIDVKTSTETEYVLTITDNDGAFDTPNLKGQKGDAGEISSLYYSNIERNPADIDYTVEPWQFQTASGGTAVTDKSVVMTFNQGQTVGFQIAGLEFKPYKFIYNVDASSISASQVGDSSVYIC